MAASFLFQPTTIGRSLVFYLPAAAGYRVIGLARGVLLAWLMTEQQFGLLQIALLAVTILFPLCGVGLHEGFARYLPLHEAAGTLRPFLRRALPLTAVLVALFCILVAAASPLVARGFFVPIDESAPTVPRETSLALARLTAAGTLVLIAYMLVLAMLRGLRLFRALSVMELIGHTLFTLLAVAVAWAGYRNSQAILVVYCIAYGAVTALFALLLARAVGQIEPGEMFTAPELPIADERPLRRMLRFSAWAALGAVLWQTLQYYPMWYLQKTQGPEVTAVYGAVRLLAQAVLIAAVSVVTVVQTAVTRTWEAEGIEPADRQLALAHKVTALVMLAGCGLLYAAGPWVMRIFPAEYAAGLPIVPLVLMFFMVGGHLAFLAVHFILIEKPRHTFAIWSVGLAGSVLFAAWLVRPGQETHAALTAAAWAGILGISLAAVLAGVVLRAEGRRLGRGIAMLVALTYVLALPILWVTVILTSALAAAVMSRAVFDAEDKKIVRAKTRALFDGVRSAIGRKRSEEAR